MISKGAFGQNSGATTTGMGLSERRRSGRYLLHLMFLAANLLVVTYSSFAADTTRVIARQRWAEFRKAYSVSSLSLTEQGTIQTVVGLLASGPSPGEQLQQAYAFLEQNKDLFRMQDPRTELVPVEDYFDDRTRMRHIKLQQFYHGVEVDGGRIGAHYSAKGLLTCINGKFYADIDLPSTPTVALTDAERTVETDSLFQDYVPSIRDGRLLIYNLMDKFFLVWKITVTPGRLSPWEYFVDALSGKIVRRHSLIQWEPSGKTGSAVPVEGPSPPMDSAALYRLSSTRMTVSCAPGFRSACAHLQQHVMCQLSGSIWLRTVTSAIRWVKTPCYMSSRPTPRGRDRGRERRERTLQTLVDRQA